ncbi:MAG TPA: aminoacyl--tRNA ligase-related protein, partial [Coxiellaceae bacterium]|nr:aminoacyl--tRNA ligase-related protein [Coxiellaceae bacterium]
MLDPKLLRQDIQKVTTALARRGFQLDFEYFASLDQKRKDLQDLTQQLQNKRNQASKAIGIAKAQGNDASELLKEMSLVAEELKTCESRLEDLQKELHDFQLTLPNILSETVPDGKSDTDNKEVRHWGDPRQFDFTPKDHIALGEERNRIDFAAAAKISGARFVVLNGSLARLQRALGQFMLDLHTREHGYQEVYVPYLVRSEALFGTGQLPKFKEDQFGIAGDFDLTLIPTAEVPVTNLVRDEILSAEQLPLKRAAITPCFRSEAGSY